MRYIEVEQCAAIYVWEYVSCSRTPWHVGMFWELNLSPSQLHRSTATPSVLWFLVDKNVIFRLLNFMTHLCGFSHWFLTHTDPRPKEFLESDWFVCWSLCKSGIWEDLKSLFLYRYVTESQLPQLPVMWGTADRQFHYFCFVFIFLFPLFILYKKCHKRQLA